VYTGNEARRASVQRRPDNGKEFAGHKSLSEALALGIYFARSFFAIKFALQKNSAFIPIKG
jgi:IS30 family transposase